MFQFLVMVLRKPEELEEWTNKAPDASLRTYLKWALRLEWGEGVVILEHAISSMGLNSEEVSERFSL